GIALVRDRADRANRLCVRVPRGRSAGGGPRRRRGGLFFLGGAKIWFGWVGPRPGVGRARSRPFSLPRPSLFFFCRLHLLPLRPSSRARPRLQRRRRGGHRSAAVLLGRRAVPRGEADSSNRAMVGASLPGSPPVVRGFHSRCPDRAGRSVVGVFGNSDE